MSPNDINNRWFVQGPTPYELIGFSAAIFSPTPVASTGSEYGKLSTFGPDRATSNRVELDLKPINISYGDATF